ncbi:Partitioning defective protein 3 [Aphelenchoides besseyi]|nr:Partitioning defective protein 3 [Aphelenchoides besseyi]
MHVLKPMATVSSTDNYVTVLSIPDDIPSTNGYRGEPSNHTPQMFSGREHQPSGQFAFAQRQVIEYPRNSPKQRRRIEFDDSSRFRAKSCHERLPTSVSEAEGLARLKRDRAHKSGYFHGLSENLEDELDEVPPEVAALGVRAQRIVLNRDTMGIATGISVTAVPDTRNPERLSAVEIYRIEAGNRIALDEQLRVGDRIIKINNRPVYQMSLNAAQLHLHELCHEAEPSILFYRIPSKPTTDAEWPVSSKPIVAEVQQGNTAVVHDVNKISVNKEKGGFQFGFASRPSQNVNIFLVTHVNPDGPCADLLKPGDRLLKIGTTDLTHLQQHEVTQLLRNCRVGETVEFEISRTPETPVELNDLTDQVTKLCVSLPIELRDLDPNDRILELHVPVNEFAAAGLGIVLKGKLSGHEKVGHSAGVYIDRILQGSAAYKDGRLRDGDRLLGIENLCLLRFTRNADAAHAFNSYIKALPPSCTSFRIFISRTGSIGGNEPNEMSRSDFTKWIQQAQKSYGDSNQNSDSATENVQRTVDQIATSSTNPPSPSAEETASIVSVPHDPFNRESATRRSFSEKGPSGMRVDPTQFENFRRIAHQRQVSAPSIGHRRYRATALQRQASAVMVKKPETKAASPEPQLNQKNNSFSLRSLFGRRSTKKADKRKAAQQFTDSSTSADKENCEAYANQIETKRRSISGEPRKSDQQLRYSSRSQENGEILANMSPSTTSPRDLSRKKRRSVGTSVLKFFQRSEPSAQTTNIQDEQPSPDLPSVSQSHKTTASPNRSTYTMQHRRFGSAHDGYQRETGSNPTGSYNWGRYPDPSSADSFHQRSNSHRFQGTNLVSGPPYRISTATHTTASPPPYCFPTSNVDYYNTFNQWFTGTSRPFAYDIPPNNNGTMPTYYNTGPQLPAGTRVEQRHASAFPYRAIVPMYTPIYPNYATAAITNEANWCSQGTGSAAPNYEFNQMANVANSLSRPSRIAQSLDTTVERL